jgi:hypothetical protein
MKIHITNDGGSIIELSNIEMSNLISILNTAISNAQSQKPDDSILFKGMKKFTREFMTDVMSTFGQREFKANDKKFVELCRKHYIKYVEKSFLPLEQKGYCIIKRRSTGVRNRMETIQFTI